jgi:hypothetical protein
MEAEISALRDALKTAQVGDVPVMQTCEHIHAVSMGLMSPWEVATIFVPCYCLVSARANRVHLWQGMLEADMKVKDLENQMKLQKAEGLREGMQQADLKVKDLENQMKLQKAEGMREGPPALPKVEANNEEVERLQKICEQQSKWILESSRNNRDRLLLVELHGHILNINAENEELRALKKLVESQKIDSVNQGESLTTRDLPKMRASPSTESLYASMDSTSASYNSSRLFSSNQQQDLRHSYAEGSVVSNNSDTVTVQRQQRVQRSAAPGALRSGPPPALRASADAELESAGLRESAINEMLSAFPDNRDIYASGASASSKYSLTDPTAYHVPEISDDILNYRPPSTAEIRRGKLAAAKSRSSPARNVLHESTNAIKPSDYMKAQELTAGRTSPRTADTKVSYSSTSMTPSEYMMSRGLQPNTTSRQLSAQNSPVSSSQSLGSPLQQAGSLTPDRLEKFAQYQQVHVILTRSSDAVAAPNRAQAWHAPVHAAP